MSLNGPAGQGGNALGPPVLGAAGHRNPQYPGAFQQALEGTGVVTSYTGSSQYPADFGPTSQLSGGTSPRRAAHTAPGSRPVFDLSADEGHGLTQNIPQPGYSNEKQYALGYPDREAELTKPAHRPGSPGFDDSDAPPGLFGEAPTGPDGEDEWVPSPHSGQVG